MLMKLILIVPSILSAALMAYLLIGLCVYFVSAYRNASAEKPARRQPRSRAANSSTAPMTVKAIPAT
jgi:hypothetical protein